MSGKGLLLQLLNGNTKIAIYPYHKFGLSCEYEKFAKLVKFEKYPYDKKYFDYKNTKKIKLRLINHDKIFQLNLSQIIYFIISQNSSIPYLLESSLTQKGIAFAADEYVHFNNFSFNFSKFINKIEQNIDSSNLNIFEIEDLDNIIFNSFLESTEEYNQKLSNLNFYSQWTSNLLDENIFLLNNYQNCKIIYVRRDLVSSSFSVAKRILSGDYHKLERLKIRGKKNPTKTDYKKIMLESIYERKKKENIFFDKIKKNVNNKNILIIDFDDLFNKRAKLLKEICKFINVEYQDSMLIPHIFSKSISNDNFNFLSMNDNPNIMFQKSEINKLHSISNSNYKLNFYKNLYKYLYR